MSTTTRSITRSWKLRSSIAAILVMLASHAHAAPSAEELSAAARAIPTLNQRADGYRGIWYFNQKSGDKYVYKYSGGMGTYCAKHRPFAVYSPQANKTFFCYGGATPQSNRELVHMVSYFDHETKIVPQPTILLNKKTNDAHDNPIISLDAQGYVWIFSTSHGRGRPSLVHRSKLPYSIDEFERVDATYEHEGSALPLLNFSYLQVWPDAQQGFTAFFTRYSDPAARTLMFMTSVDGHHWSRWQRLAAIEEGHYQVSTAEGLHAASAFNFHPKGKGLNYRTNLYYLETRDGGKSWQNVEGQALELPLTKRDNAVLVHDYASEGKNVYMKDLQFDEDGHPVILCITSGGYESGPSNDPRTWTLVRWTGDQWKYSEVTRSDNNYDMGSLYLADDQWRLIAPTSTGPQDYNPGGEVVMWTSTDRGESWSKMRQLTQASEYNHSYVRRPIDAHPDFYALWADGHGRQPSESRLYFCNQQGEVFQLPASMDDDHARPIPVPVQLGELP